MAEKIVNAGRLIVRYKKLLIGVIMLSAMVIFCVPGMILYPVDPRAIIFRDLQPPSSTNPLGTDVFGRDVLAQLIHGTYNSFRIGILAGLIATLIGIAIGATAGYFGGIVDDILNLVTNTFLVIPTLALLIVIASYIRIRSELMMILIIGATSWPWTARAIRAQVYSLKAREFVDLAKISGLPRHEIIIFEILPNMLSYIVMCFTLQMAGAILSEAGLSAIGLGPTALITLGMILRWTIVWEAPRIGTWWWFVPPGLIITLIAVSFLLINSGLDEIYNPRLRRMR
ncbi:ABC transporter permease [Candidatus Bathyarchaeota archaeon]|nr:MAG: ABC transporter permease [Candidatus Bathyarchaeota archaeon]